MEYSFTLRLGVAFVFVAATRAAAGQPSVALNRGKDDIDNVICIKGDYPWYISMYFEMS